MIENILKLFEPKNPPMTYPDNNTLFIAKVNPKLTEAEQIETHIYQIFYQKCPKISRDGYHQRAIDRAKRSKDPVKELNQLLEQYILWSKR